MVGVLAIGSKVCGFIPGPHVVKLYGKLQNPSKYERKIS
jgi:hypothetical protein